MMSDITSLYELCASWVHSHPMAAAIVAYVAWNVSSRIPPPKNRYLYWLWDLSERLCFLAWGKWGGPLKPLFSSKQAQDLKPPPAILPILMLCVGCSWMSGAVRSDMRTKAIDDINTTIHTVHAGLDAIDAEWISVCHDDPSFCRQEGARYASAVSTVSHALATVEALIASGTTPSLGTLMAAFAELASWVTRVSAVRYGYHTVDACVQPSEPQYTW
jgi:hypothetical protein